MTSETNPLKERLKNMSPDQIRKLMAGKQRSSARTFSRMPRNPEERYPLSRAQERIWFLAKLYPESPLYNIPIAINIRSGEINPYRLKKVINRIVRKNEIFRTTFHEKGGELLQQVHPALDIEVDFEDISQLDISIDKEKIAAKIGERHGNALFDLAKLPLLSVKLLKKGENDYTLYFNLHHMISDGWTNSLLARDSAFYYDNSGISVPEKEVIQYVDYVKWEQEWLKSERYDKELGFWKKELEDLPEPLHFPRDFTAQGHFFEGRTEHGEIPFVLHDKVATFCQKNSLTPYQFYVSCYALLMAKYTGNRDILVGTPVANRNQPFFRETYGVFINSLPLRFKIDAALSFAELIAGFKEMILSCMANQEMPFSEIISAVNPQRKLHENPLYSIHFAYQHFPQKDKRDEHVLLPIDYRITKFDINFWIKVAGDECSLSVSYKNRLIRREKICRFMEHFLLLVEAVVAHPDISFKELNFIPVQHLSRLVGESIPYPETSWLNLFEKSCQAFSTAIALIDEQGEMTYAVLESKVSALARDLSQRGIEKDDIVIIRTGRDRKFVISILACMQCGATYLPVDRQIPGQRFSHILNDSQARIVLTDIDIDGISCLNPAITDRIESAGEPSFETAVVGSEDIVYIVYTSGSTGAPKGVCIPHRALTNHVLALERGLGEPDSIRSFAHVSALDADLGNTPFFLALATGRTLVMPPFEALIDPVLLAAFFSQHPVDAFKIVPAHLSALREHLTAILPRKLLIFAGEKLSPQLVSEVQQAAPKLRIMNYYGPAEATISCVTFAVPAGFNGAVVPIGQPIANCSLCLLDQDMSLVPKGGRGEICLAGVNLAQGYFNQPGLTAAKFVENLSLCPGPIYQTGDMAYIDEDNQVVFLDRGDRQVKINGFRIEPGEIESVIKRHQAVTSAAVFISEGGGGLKRLHAAVVLCTPLGVPQLKSYLAQYLPRPIIPAITILDEIPVTRNGKVDSDRVQGLCAELGTKNRRSQPSDLIELQLAAIFKAVLQVPRVYPDDHFFDLGGHSLLAISLISQINRSFRTNFPIATLFEYGSVNELATLVRSAAETVPGADSPYVTLINSGSEKRVVWVHPAGGNVMSYYPVANFLSSNYVTKAFLARDHHGRDDLSIKGMALEYAGILQKHREISGTFLAGWSMGALIAHDMAVFLAAKERELPLILVDQPVPHYGDKASISYEDKLINYIERIEVFAGDTIKLSATPERRLDYALLRNEFIRLGLMPAEVTEDGFRDFLDVLVQHNNIVTNFSPTVYHGPVLLLKASDKLMLETNNPQPEYLLDDLGWSDYCKNLTIIEVPGNHITMMTEKHAAKVAAVIHSWISTLNN